jgi:hypothetical protein
MTPPTQSQETAGQVPLPRVKELAERCRARPLVYGGNVIWELAVRLESELAQSKAAWDHATKSLANATAEINDLEDQRAKLLAEGSTHSALVKRVEEFLDADAALISANNDHSFAVAANNGEGVHVDAARATCNAAADRHEKALIALRAALHQSAQG